MKAMVLEKAKTPLKMEDVPKPVPNDNQVLIKVAVCGVCRTDLHIVDGELFNPKLPLIPGHEIVGYVVGKGKGVTLFNEGERVGVPWLGYTCGKCVYCRRGQENLCQNPLFTGYTINGGYAEYTVADQRYCFKIPEGYTEEKAAPLLCAGLIGYRSYRMAGEDIKRLGIYGFGGAAHILVQVAKFKNQEVYAFTRPGDKEAKNFALQLGSVWAGGSNEIPPEKLDAAIIFAPVGALVPQALKMVDKGRRVICGGIHMSDIPSFAYQLLWEERSIHSVANLKREDGVDFFKIATELSIKTETTIYPLSKANEALADLRDGTIKGTAVISFMDSFNF